MTYEGLSLTPRHTCHRTVDRRRVKGIDGSPGNQSPARHTIPPPTCAKHSVNSTTTYRKASRVWATRSRIDYQKHSLRINLCLQVFFAFVPVRTRLPRASQFGNLRPTTASLICWSSPTLIVHHRLLNRQVYTLNYTLRFVVFHIISKWSSRNAVINRTSLLLAVTLPQV